VFQARFPKFRGYRVVATRRANCTDFDLTDGPPELNADEVSPLDVLDAELNKFLNWELRKIPMEMIFTTHISRGKRKILTCRIVYFFYEDWYGDPRA